MPTCVARAGLRDPWPRSACGARAAMRRVMLWPCAGKLHQGGAGPGLGAQAPRASAGPCALGHVLGRGVPRRRASCRTGGASAAWAARRLSAAQAALDARNARYRSGGGAGGAAAAASRGAAGEEDDVSERVVGRLGQAEKAVEKFVARRLKAVQPVVDKARPRAAPGPARGPARPSGAGAASARSLAAWPAPAPCCAPAIRAPAARVGRPRRGGAALSATPWHCWRCWRR